jgi:hypothetical protein
MVLNSKVHLSNLFVLPRYHQAQLMNTNFRIECTLVQQLWTSGVRTCRTPADLHKQYTVKPYSLALGSLVIQVNSIDLAFNLLEVISLSVYGLESETVKTQDGHHDMSLKVYSFLRGVLSTQSSNNLHLYFNFILFYSLIRT